MNTHFDLKMVESIARTIRRLTLDAIAQAGSGHPGMPMGCAEIFAYLYAVFMRYHPSHTDWINRDRLILSAGHGFLGQLIPLHLAGYDITLADLQKHQQGNEKSSSHPQYNPTLGIETSTGADGFGIANAVGMALGQKILRHAFYRNYQDLFQEKIIVIAGDGCVMEGICYEAAQLAGHFQLNNLIVIHDSNKVSLDGYIHETSSTNYKKLFEAMGFQVDEIDGHDIYQLDCVLRPLRTKQTKPVFLIAHTEIGKGLPSKQGTPFAHKSNFTPDDILKAKQCLGLESQGSFEIDPSIYTFFEKRHEATKRHIQLKTKPLALEKSKLIHLVSQLQFENPLLPGRFLSQEVLNFLFRHIPAIYSGSADSSHSDGTWIKESNVVQAPHYLGKNIKFGVREFGMASIAIGLSQTQMLIPVIGGFLAFSDYLKPALRFAAMMHTQLICHFSHDSIFVGEDGPTHQPIEQLAALRAMPNTLVIRPADASEIRFAWIAALLHQGPTVLALSKQPLPHLQLATDYETSVQKGAYIVFRSNNPDVVFYASGSEVALALEVANLLTDKNISVTVVSVPCFELFFKQDTMYQNTILNRKAKLSVSIEAASPLGWHQFVGKNGLCISVNQFGLSASENKLRHQFGFTASHICQQIEHELTKK